MKLAPAAAMALSGVALIILALAPLGTARGWWHFGFGLLDDADVGLRGGNRGRSRCRDVGAGLVEGTPARPCRAGRRAHHGVDPGVRALAVSAHPLDPAAHSRHHHGYRYPRGRGERVRVGDLGRSAGGSEPVQPQQHLPDRTCPIAEFGSPGNPKALHRRGPAPQARRQVGGRLFC